MARPVRVAPARASCDTSATQMNLNVVLGGFMVVYGVVTFCVRTFARKRSWKLEVMQKKWGEQRGLLIHVVSYTVFPIVLGAILIIRGLAAPAG